MSRRGKNIFKRKDGRWEGRYISGYKENGRAKYSSVYAYSYGDCSQKLQLAMVGNPPKGVPITVSELFAMWLTSRKNVIKPSTYSNYRTIYNNYIDETFGKMRVEKVTSFMLNCFITELLKHGNMEGDCLSPKSVQAIMIMFKSVFSYGEKEFGLNNPGKNVALPKSEFKQIEVFSKAEMEKIRKHALDDDCQILGVILCLYTGLRIGEICALKWEDIDISNRVIHVRKTLQRIKNPESLSPKTVVIIDNPKSVKSIRDIPIPDFLLSRLSQIKCNVSFDSYFLTGTDHYIEPRTYQYRYKVFLKNIHVSYKNFHVLRHTFATECIRLGVDVKTVSELLGHANVRITLERYVHSSMEMKRKQLEKLYDSV